MYKYIFYKSTLMIMHLLIYSVPYFPCKLYIGWVNENACDSTYVYVQSNHVNCKQFL